MKASNSIIIHLLVISFFFLQTSGIHGQTLPAQGGIVPMVAQCDVFSISPSSYSNLDYRAGIVGTVSVSSLNNCTNYILSCTNWITATQVTGGVQISVSLNTGCSSRTGYVNIGTFTVTVTQSAQPAINPGAIGSSQSICYSAIPASLTNVTSASGGNNTFSYQWQSSPDNSTWSNISNATKLTYAPGGLTTTTYYRRNVTSGSCGPASSNAVTITVNPNLTAGTIGSNQSICYNNSPATLTNTSSPTGGTGTYTYQWQSSPDNTTWTNITGATSSTYSPGALTINTYYRRNVSSGSCGPVSSGSVLIIVYANLSAGSIGSPQTICYNSTPATLINMTSPSGGTGTYTYQWQSSPDNATWTNITGDTSSTYSPGTLTTNTYFRRNVTSGSCGPVSSGSVLITVYGNLSAGSIGSPQTICYNSTPATLINVTSPSGGTGSYTYQWQSSPNNTTWTNITGATSPTYSPGALTTNTYFRRNVTSGSCGTVSSGSVLITVYSNLSAGSVGSSQAICYNAIPEILKNTASPIGGTGSYTYQWQISDDSLTWINITGATSTNYQPGVITKTTYFKRTVNSGTCGSVSSNLIKVTTKSPVSLSCDQLESSILAGSSTRIEISGANSYTWSPSTGLSSDIGSIVIASPDTTTSYIVTGTSGNNCSVLYITVNVSVSASIKANGNILTAIVTGGNVDSCKWNTGQVGRTITASSAGYYSVRLKVANNQYASAAFWYGSTPISNSMNYIRTRSAQVAISDSLREGDTDPNRILTEFSYLDGLGRPLQNVAVKMSPEGKDMITHFEYDNYGRQLYDFLPYAEFNSNNNGSYVNNPRTGLQNFYYLNQGDTGFYYSQKVMENSPLGRILEQGFPGKAWQPYSISIDGSGHTNKMKYLTNSENEVKNWLVNTSDNCVFSSVNNGYYQAGTLYVIQSTDENGHYSKEYKNKDGKVILKRQYLEFDSLQTYYVYDDWGRLRYVLTPMATPVLSSTNKPQDALIRNLCYYYKYDSRGRMVLKQLPGADSVLMVYNKLDQLVLVQDGLARSKGYWMFTKYDIQGRTILTGTFNSALGRSEQQVLVDNLSWSSLFESRSAGGVHGYTNNAYPNVSDLNQYLTVAYFDDHDINQDSSEDVLYQSKSGFTGIPFTSLKGKLCRSKIKVLDQNLFLTTDIFYDKYYRIIESIADNYLSGKDTLNNEYSFDGKVMKTRFSQYIQGKPANTVLKTFTYDQAKRLLSITNKINNRTETKVSSSAYNELGQLLKKKLHRKFDGSNLQDIDYAYNYRGWLTNINDPFNIGTDYFALRLLYNDSLAGSLSNVPQYNGNISGVYWMNKPFFTDTINYYAFNYDPVNRLLGCGHAQSKGGVAWTGDRKYLERGIDYDRNGNIMSLNRYDRSGTVMDSLVYRYKNGNLSNQLDSIHDYGGNGSGDFNDRVGVMDYLFDLNGNMISDQNKGIDTINYNLLNLPSRINSGLNTLKYIYAENGSKLARVNPDGTIRYYLEGFEYDNAKNLNLMPFEEGIISVNDTTFSYEYYLKDHLGNTRVIFNEQGILTQNADYYPFGMSFLPRNMGTSINKYLYNGKELQDVTLGNGQNLDWLDYGARFYDAQIGRWTTPDPINQYSSPYIYVGNDPIRLHDPNGMWSSEQNNPMQIASTFINSHGIIIDVRPFDNDCNIYLVLDPTNWDKSKKGLPVIGRTPEPGTLSRYKGSQLRTEEVLNYINSESERLGKSPWINYGALANLEAAPLVKKRIEIENILIEEMKYYQATGKYNINKLNEIHKECEGLTVDERKYIFMLLENALENTGEVTLELSKTFLEIIVHRVLFLPPMIENEILYPGTKKVSRMPLI